MTRFELFFIAALLGILVVTRIAFSPREFPPMRGTDVDVVATLLYHHMVIENYSEDSIPLPQMVLEGPSAGLPEGVHITLQNTLRFEGITGYLFFLNVQSEGELRRRPTLPPVDIRNLYDEWERSFDPELDRISMDPFIHNEDAEGDGLGPRMLLVDLRFLFDGRAVPIRWSVGAWPPEADPSPGRIRRVGHGVVEAEAGHIYPLVVLVGSSRPWFGEPPPEYRALRPVR